MERVGGHWAHDAPASLASFPQSIPHLFILLTCQSSRANSRGDARRIGCPREVPSRKIECFGYNVDYHLRRYHVVRQYYSSTVWTG